MDPNNTVVRLCAEGMAAEGEGRFDDARILFERAWASAVDDYERSIAAHYVARHQPTPEETLRWNREALECAERVGDDRVEGFFPSLLLNMGHAHEHLEEWEEARRFYRSAEERLDILDDTPYAAMVRDGVARGLERIAGR